MCCILDNYDLTPSRLWTSVDHCHIILEDEYPYIPVYVMSDIKNLGFEHFGICKAGNNLALILEKEVGSVLTLSEFFDMFPK